MKYFLISREDAPLNLESFKARSDKEALLYVVSTWSEFTENDEYDWCKHKSIKDIGDYLASLNIFHGITNLALYRETDINTFGKGDPKTPLWDIYDYIDEDEVNRNS